MDVGDCFRSIVVDAGDCFRNIVMEEPSRSPMTINATGLNFMIPPNVQCKGSIENIYLENTYGVWSPRGESNP